MRKSFDKEFMARVALEAIKEEKTARSGEKLWSVRKGNSSRPTGSFRYPSAHGY
ncbi:hypothetical protein BPIT_09910 [Candidatus Brocadia pituitae]|nr:hypothetical protein BPIT_09910 [Candidatus Brocadia pituitae]